MKIPHNKRKITFYIHNRAHLFETILPGIFTIGEEEGFKIDQRKFKKYLKITFLSDKSVIKVIYDIKQDRYVYKLIILDKDILNSHTIMMDLIWVF